MDLPPSVTQALASIYGDDAPGRAGQQQRYGSALRQFYELAGRGAVTLVRAPGRVNLIGEHTDYNHGYVLPIALDKDTVLVVRPRSDRTVRLWNSEPERFAHRQFALSEKIAPGPLGDWGNYVRAAAQALFVQSGGALRGMDILVSGAAPWGTPRAAGLSSSSALLVATALAFTTLNGIQMGKVAFARMCSEAEWYVGTRGGIMDHFSSVLGQRGHALLLDCRPQVDAHGLAHYEMQPVRMPDGYQVIICNSGVQRQKTRSQYNVRVAECRLAVALLKRSHPTMTHLRDASAGALGMPHEGVMALIETLPARLSTKEIAGDGALRDVLRSLDAAFPAGQQFMVRARARHVVSENERVLAGVQALRSGDAAAFGALMNAAHESMSRDYAASCPQVDTLAALARRAPGVLGARVTGAGWGGCVVALAGDSATSFADAVAQAYAAATGLQTDIFVCRSGPGASVVGDVA